MSYTRTSLAAAEREASDRNVMAAQAGGSLRFRAQRYPNGTPHVETWPWGVASIQLNYGKNGESRFAGFVWLAPTNRTWRDQ